MNMMKDSRSDSLTTVPFVILFWTRIIDLCTEYVSAPALVVLLYQIVKIRFDLSCSVLSGHFSMSIPCNSWHTSECTQPFSCVTLHWQRVQAILEPQTPGTVAVTLLQQAGSTLLGLAVLMGDRQDVYLTCLHLYRIVCQQFQLNIILSLLSLDQQHKKQIRSS